jgi:cell division septum initiation protein DivIVA
MTGLSGFAEEELTVEPESVKTFVRAFRGYQSAAVDAHIEMLSTKQHLLSDDVEKLRGRLREVGDEAAALRREVGLLTDTSPSPHAVQQRMAQMLRRAVDEVSEMQAEARAEADAMVETAEAEAKAAQQRHTEVLADLADRRAALEAEYQETKQQLETELSGLRADAQDAREQLLADAKQEADHYREHAQRAVDEAIQQRIDVLEQLMGVYRDLEGVPATLESAYQELKNPSE